MNYRIFGNQQNLIETITNAVDIINKFMYFLQVFFFTGIDPKNSKEHKKYIDDLCVEFESSIREAIDKGWTLK